MGRVEGKVALVTGAARGQGRSHALRLAQEGADIIAVDLTAPVETVPYPMASPADLEETVAQIEKLDRRVVAAQRDVRDLAALTEFVGEAVGELGRLDVICANAGVFSPSLVMDLTEEMWQETVDINLTGVWKTLKAGVPHIVAGGRGGSLILTSSIATEVAHPATGHYTATKYGVLGLSRVLAKELGPLSIRVNTVHPTNIDTGMTHNDTIIRMFRPDLENPTFADYDEAAKAMNVLPVGALAPVEVSNAVVFLASDESQFITGTEIHVDAGTKLV